MDLDSGEDTHKNNDMSVTEKPTNPSPIVKDNTTIISRLMSKKIITIIIIVSIVAAATAAAFIILTNNSKKVVDISPKNSNAKNQKQSIKDRVVFDEVEVIDTSGSLKHTLKSVDLVGNVRTIYSFNQNDNNSIPNMWITKNNDLYIQKKSSNKEYIVVDENGKDITESKYKFLQQLEYPSSYNHITNETNNTLIYSKEEIKQFDKSLYVKKIANNEERVLKIHTGDSYDLSTMGGLSPIGWSKDKNTLYVKFTGYEGVQYSKLWRVNIDNNVVERVDTVDNMAIWNLRVYPELDMALGVEASELFSSPSATGQASAPSKLFLIDIKNNSKKLIATSEDSLIDNFFLSIDAKRVFYQERENDTKYTSPDEMTNNSSEQSWPKVLKTKILNLETNKYNEAPINKYVRYCTPDLSVAVLMSDEPGMWGREQINMVNTSDNSTVINLKGNVTSYSDRETGQKYYELIGYFQ